MSSLPSLSFGLITQQLKGLLCGSSHSLHISPFGLHPFFPDASLQPWPMDLGMALLASALNRKYLWTPAPVSWIARPWPYLHFTLARFQLLSPSSSPLVRPAVCLDPPTPGGPLSFSCPQVLLGPLLSSDSAKPKPLVITITKTSVH